MILFLSQLQQLLCSRDLSDLGLSDIGLQPVHEFRHCDTIANVAAAGVLQLDRILHRFHQYDRIRLIDDAYALRQR